MKAHEKVSASFEHRLLPSVRRLASSPGEEKEEAEGANVLDSESDVSVSTSTDVEKGDRRIGVAEE